MYLLYRRGVSLHTLEIITYVRVTPPAPPTMKQSTPSYAAMAGSQGMYPEAVVVLLALLQRMRPR